MPNPDRPLRVLIVDDSAVVRDTLQLILEEDGDITVVGKGEDAFSAMALVEQLRPDVVTMDVQMPGKSGLEAVEQIMARCPVPIVVVTGQPVGDNELGFNAIERGALEIVAKPSLADADSGAALRALLRSLANVPVFHFASADAPKTTPPPAVEGTEVMAVAAGAGGLPSVLSFVGHLPQKLPCPVVIQYAVASEMASSLARYLHSSSGIRVHLVERGGGSAAVPVDLFSAEIFLAHDGLVAFGDRGQISVRAGEPSVSAFFHSLAETYGARAAGAILGGAGKEGADGLLAVRRAGGRTYAEGVLTGSVLAELPQSAIDAGAVETVCAPDQLAMALGRKAT
jgi:two-component system chemotaxis response regulator CheB